MVVKKPRIVIIGAGMAGLVAANKLYTSPGTKEVFELCIVEGGNRIGGRILTSEIGGDRIEMGATWIHGIGGSPIFKIAEEIGALDSKQPWEHKDGYPKDLLTVAEGGLVLDSAFIVEPISNLYRNLMDYAQGKLVESSETYKKNSSISNGYSDKLSIGSFLRKGLEAYWNSAKSEDKMVKSLEEAVFAMHENEERAHTSAGELSNLDYNAESEYKNFPDEELTIAKGYFRVIQSLASVLPNGLIQLGKKVEKIEWKDENDAAMEMENGYGSSGRPVKLHFDDGSIMVADHVIVTVSLGVLKAGIRDASPSGMCFSPPLPSFKTDAISRLGFGIVNKLFLELNPTHHDSHKNFPNLQMAFHSSSSELRKQEIPWWMRRTASLSPIYNNSIVLLSWFAGKEALEVESLKDEDIIKGITTTISSFLPESKPRKVSKPQQCCNGSAKTIEPVIKFARVVKSKWGTDPLFMGSYSYVAVGSSGKDLDSMAEPLPIIKSSSDCSCAHPLQILFAGEATHRTHYSTTHGAYFSGEREANRILKYYNL